MQEVGEGHLKIAIFHFLACENFKHFLRSRIESNFIFVVASNSILSGSLTLGLLLVLKKVKAKCGWTHKVSHVYSTLILLLLVEGI